VLLVKQIGLQLSKKVKLQRAHGGYLGTQRRRRTRLPAIRFGESEADIDPEISEWGNP
jgi:antitoxin component of MazEF toxin-antitoxin module